ETLARARSAALDKTGTLTLGQPTVVDVRPGALSADDTLRVAAAAEQYSVHVFADPIVQHARRRAAALPEVSTAEEVATNGVQATLADGTEVRVGKPAFIEEVTGPLRRAELRSGETAVYVATGERLAGVIVLSDPLRPNAAETVERLRARGVARIVMLTGDVR